MRVLVLLAVLSQPAAADNTVPSPASPARRCSMMDAPYHKAQNLEVPVVGFSLASRAKRHALFRRYWEKPEQFLVWDTQRKAVVLRHDAEAAGVVERPDGTLIGALRVVGDSFQLLDGKGVVWTSAPILRGTRPDSATVRVVGDLLLVASFHRIATGSQLAALELASGKTRWIAEVLQLDIPHSKYFNDVDLAVAADGASVEMLGYEAGGCYTQNFAVATGQRLRAQLDKH